MEDAPSFEFVCAELEKHTTLTRLEARGTVRIVLRDAGLEPHAVTAAQMEVVLDRLLPAALRKRRIEGEQGICAAVKASLKAQPVLAPKHEAPDDVLRRFGRRT